VAEADRRRRGFVTRLKDSTGYTILEERAVREGSGVLRDEVIVLDSEKDPDHLMRLRRIEVWLEDKQETIAFVTNNLKLAASTIAAIYRDRWQIELLRIQSDQPAVPAHQDRSSGPDDAQMRCG
jgi:IS4 transposase